METKIINGKEYTKVGITQLSINGENKENSFSYNDVDNQGQIFFDIKIDSGTYVDEFSFSPSSLYTKNQELNNNIKISDKPIAKASIDTSNHTENSTDSIDNSNDNKSIFINNQKISYWCYLILAMSLVGFLYFIFIK